MIFFLFKLKQKTRLTQTKRHTIKQTNKQSNLEPHKLQTQIKKKNKGNLAESSSQLTFNREFLRTKNKWQTLMQFTKMTFQTMFWMIRITQRGQSRSSFEDVEILRCKYL